MEYERPLNLYTRTLMERFSLTEEKARAVEDILRETYGTLDALTKAQFNSSAKKAIKIVEGK